MNRARLVVALCVYLWAICCVAGASDSVLVKEGACFSAKKFESGYTFNAPYSGTLKSVELQHVSGDVTCAGGRGLSYFGCVSSAGVRNFRVNMLRHNDDGSEDLLFPAADDDAISTIEYDSKCNSGHECKVFRYFYDDNDLSDTLQWNSDGGVAVEQGDAFSLQYHEGCCGESTGDNSGTSCVDVYFQYEQRECLASDIEGVRNEIQDLRELIQDIHGHFAHSSAHSVAGMVDEGMTADSMMTLTAKDMAIVALLAVNLVIIATLCVVCRTGSGGKYVYGQ